MTEQERLKRNEASRRSKAKARLRKENPQKRSETKAAYKARIEALFAKGETATTTKTKRTHLIKVTSPTTPPTTTDPTQKITSIDRASLQLLRGEMDAALAVVAAKYGLTIKCGNGKYAIANGSFTVNIATTDEGGDARTQEAVEYDRWQALRNLPDRGTEFTSRGETFCIVGYRPRAHKRPILVTRVRDGKSFVFPVDSVKRLCGITTTTETRELF